MERTIITKPLKKSIYFGILFIGLMGVPIHYLYSLSGNSPVAAFISPVNESVWEHLKLHVLPMVIWWCALYIVLIRKDYVSFPGWFVSFVTAFVVCPLMIVLFYYTYTGALGIHSLALDMFSYFLGVTLAQLFALHIYRYAKIGSLHFYISAILFTLLMVSFIIFTFDPPRLPIFKAPQN